MTAPRTTQVKDASLSVGEIYIREGCRYLPHLMELLDRNPLSHTYGCFDRSYWHFKTADFPSGMYQEAVLPLALALNLQSPHNPLNGKERVRELVLAGCRFADRSAHRDGSCDDYFPFERAAGAAAFALYAMSEACLLLDIRDPDILSFLARRATYIDRKGFDESGTLSNHKALMVLGLTNAFLVTNNTEFRDAASRRLGELLNLQTTEGWFPEYEGCDPGYLSFTVDFLAKYWDKSRDESVVPALRKAVGFLSDCMSPDGTIGGEYGSRNTFHVLPHGLELLADTMPEARHLSDRFAEAVSTGKRTFLEDDRIFIHYVYNFLQAGLLAGSRVPETSNANQNFDKDFPEAGFRIKQAGDTFALLSVSKGGVLKVYRNNRLVWSDTGLTGVLKDGRKFTSTASGIGTTKTEDGCIEISGDCQAVRDLLLKGWLAIAFRIFMLSIGRFLPANTVRSLIQKKAITRKKDPVPVRFTKRIDWKSLRKMEVRLLISDPSVQVDSLWLSRDATFIYVATSQPFQPGNLLPWIDLSNRLDELNQKRTLTFELDLE